MATKSGRLGWEAAQSVGDLGLVVWPGILTVMPRSQSNFDQIQTDLAVLNAPIDPNRCGCQDKRCSAGEGHERGACGREPETKIWTHRWEFLCGRCREYYFGGSRDGLS